VEGLKVGFRFSEAPRPTPPQAYRVLFYARRDGRADYPLPVGGGVMQADQTVG